MTGKLIGALGARERFRRLRRLAFDSAEALLKADFGIDARFTEIDRDATRAFRATWALYPRPAWSGDPPDWYRLSLTRRAIYDRFDAALWHGETLCGLVMGRPSRGRTFLRVDLLEGSPDPHHPLKRAVLLSVADAALRYGRALGCRQLRIMDPLPGAVRWYKEFDFQLVEPLKGRTYCAAEIE
jgi:hypothetical protein